jgi:hypothetical protein
MRDKREKFVELAEKRVVRVLQSIRLVGNLANRNNYDYTESDFDKILSAIDGEVKRLKARVRAYDQSEETKFRLNP